MIKYGEALTKYLQTVRKSTELSGCIRTRYLDLAVEIATLVLNENTDITCKVTIELDSLPEPGHDGPTWLVYWEEV